LNSAQKHVKNYLAGVDKLANAVTATLGPNGRNVVIANPGIPQSTKDGVTVAKSITLEDPIEELGVQLVKQAAIKTADNAGDGTTTSTLLAQEIVNQGLKELSNDRNAVQLKREIDTAVKQVLEAVRTRNSSKIFQMLINLNKSLLFQQIMILK
jgi:chaperonin GroEL